MALTDRDALVALFRSTGGASWDKKDNWDTAAEIATWSGVQVNDEGRVVKLRLKSNNLRGPIPPQLGNLSFLESLDLGINKLGGHIPKELGALTILEQLWLERNQLTGPIPPEVGNLRELKALWLSGNQLTGAIPAQHGALSELTCLNLSKNQLSGEIPALLGQLSKLDSLYLHQNQLSGPILKELGALTKLTSLFLRSNKLTGPIPPELGKLVALESLDLTGNQLTGAIPAQLGALNKLTGLNLSNNQLSGRIPPEVGKLGAVQQLDLWGNKLSGPIPKELGALTKLTSLFLRSNRLSDPIPPEMGNLSALQHLELQNNQLSGPMPSEVGNLRELKTLWLSGNQLTGAIPAQLGALNELTCLNLSKNQLSGEIPASLGQLSKLDSLYLHQNNLSGYIPKELGSLSKLGVLRLNNNELTGPIPNELGALTKLTSLFLVCNKLTGAIPAQLAALKELARLLLSGNQLSGPIPPGLGKLASLTCLNLRENELNGPIPNELGGLTDLKVLGLSNNKLTGPIPPELGNLGALKTLDLGTNELTGLWDHTCNVEDVGQERANRMSGGTIPSELRRLLETLDGADTDLGGNPWAEPPESIVTKGMESVRGYFEDLYAEPCRVQRSSVKVVLVGQEGAGKTSLRQSMKANEATPTGEWKEESTVFADVQPMELEGSSVRVYDCAGQVGYTGLLQMFLTPRSVCVLVCNVEAFEQRLGSEANGQVQEDWRKLEELRVCDWLRSISRRVPYSDVILVATKCDLASGNAGDMGKRLEHACRLWLSNWVRNGMQPVRLEHGVCLTSCCPAAVSEHGENSPGNHCAKGGWGCDWRDHRDDNSSPSLLHRLVNKLDGGGLRGAQMVLPRSWDMALTVLEALELGRDPVEMVLQKIADPDRENVTDTAKGNTDVYQGITVEDLNAKWQATVDGLAKGGIAVTNADNALEGALSIR
ncbi:unnamed protein product [Ectocarpus sp. 8 AP-2014]